MTDTSPLLLVRPDRPVDGVTVAILRHIHEATTALTLDYFVTGATARDLMLFHVYGLRAMRATIDIDLGVAVADWDQFRQLTSRLLASTCFFSVANVEHRLLCRLSPEAAPVPIDLIPFSGVEDANGMLRWPPGTDSILTVVGFDDALRGTVRVQVQPGFTAPVASLPGLVLLKLFAWLDRLSPKDATDIVAVVRNYADAGQTDRIYDVEGDLLVEADYDLEVAGALLLAKDVKEIAALDTLERLSIALRKADALNRMIAQAAAATGSVEPDRALAEVHRLMAPFWNRLFGSAPQGQEEKPTRRQHPQRSERE